MATLNIDLTGELGLAGNLSQEIWQTTAQPNLNYTAQDGEMVSGIYNPLMRNGYLYPSNNSLLTVEVPAISDGWVASIVDPEIGIILSNEDDNFYTFDDSFVGGAITYTYHKLDGVRLVNAATVDLVTDLETYQINGVKTIFYVTVGATGNVGIATTNLGTIDDNWLSTVCSGGTVLKGTGRYGFLVKSDNGLLYIFDDYAVHSIDGNATGGVNGTARMNLLVFPEDLMRIVDAIDYKGRLFIAINEESTSHNDRDDKSYSKTYTNGSGVYVWNRLSTVVSMQDYVTVENCQRINRIWVGPNGEILLMSIGANGNNQIRQFDGSKFIVIKELPFETKVASKDGLLVAEGATFWAGVDGYLYCGKIISGRFCVYRLAQFHSGTLDSSFGPVLTYSGANSFDSNTGFRSIRPNILIAYRPTSSNAVVKKFYIYGTDTLIDTTGSDGSGYIDPNPFLFNPNQGDVLTGVKLLPTLSTVKDVIIRCIPTASASTTIATIKYYFNNSATPTVTKTVTMADTAKGYVAHAINRQNINSIQIEIEWATGVTMGVNDFAPYLATVTYETTTTNTRDDG